MGVLSNLIVRIGASTDDFDKKLNSSLGKIQRFGASMSQAGQALSIGFSAPLIAAGAGALSAAADMEKLEKGLTATMKSSAAAGKEMERLKVVSKLPGLGLQEAVQGSIRLQTLGSSADESRKIMMELGNALATVGGGKEDFKEVIRQLSQLSAVGKVTKENLDPIIERIPQIAAIMREKFGPESLGDPAKTFERLGISSKQFIDIIVAELGKGERAGATFANSLENLKESAFETAAEFGKSLLPIGQRLLSEFINPAVEKAKELAKEFGQLQPATQNAAIGVTAFATALPLAVVGIGTVIEKGAAIIQAMNRLKGSFGLTGTAANALGTAVGYLAIAMRTYEDVTRLAKAVMDLWKEADYAFGITDKFRSAWAMSRDVFIALLPVFSKVQGYLQTIAKQAETLARMLSPIFAFAKVYESAADALRKWNGESRAMDEAIRSNLSTSLKAAVNENEAILRRGELESQLGRVRGKLDEATAATDKNGAANGKLKPAITAAKEAVDQLAQAFTRLGVSNTSDAIGGFARARQALSVIEQAFRDGKVSTIDLQRATESLGQEYLKFIDGVGGIRPAMVDVADSFDFAAERAMMAIGDIQTAAQSARNLALGQMIVTGDPTGAGATLNSADAARSSQRNLEIIRQTARGASDAWKNVRTGISRQVSTIQTDFSRAVVNIIRGTESIGEAMRKVGNAAVDGLLRTGIEFAVNEGIKLLGKLLTKLGGVSAKIGGILGGTGGGGTSGGGGAQGGIGSAVSAASGGILGMVTSIGSLVSGVIGNFQMAGMNKTLDLIEKEVRFSQIHLLHILEKQNEYLPKLKDIWDSLIRMETRQMGVAGGGGATVNINVHGGDPRQMLEAITRELKQLGVIPK
jgi:tape measure domain-containing protein